MTEEFFSSTGFVRWIDRPTDYGLNWVICTERSPGPCLVSSPIRQTNQLCNTDSSSCHEYRLADNQKHGKWNKSKRPIEFDVHVFEIIIEGVLITEYEDRNKTSAKNNCLRQVGSPWNCVSKLSVIMELEEIKHFFCRPFRWWTCSPTASTWKWIRTHGPQGNDFTRGKAGRRLPKAPTGNQNSSRFRLNKLWQYDIKWKDVASYSIALMICQIYSLSKDNKSE